MKKILIANWKMCDKSALDALHFLKDLPNSQKKDIRIAAPFTLIREMAGNSLKIRIGGQNMHSFSEGAFTGEISARMLREAGADFVILGHSERRHLLGETNEFIQGKVERALVEGFSFVLCVGETLEEKDSEETFDVIEDQLDKAFDGISEEQLEKCGALIAYEPVWAIGTGKSAEISEIMKVHEFIKKKYDLPVLYGGSVNLENFQKLLAARSIDGVLVGGASLGAATFGQMIQLLPEG
jgi:triosephosphate isomerase